MCIILPEITVAFSRNRMYNKRREDLRDDAGGSAKIEGTGGETLNRRIVTMIADLAQSGEQETLKHLSAHYGVSTRTIRNDLASINQLLDENGLHQIQIGSGGVLKLEDDFPKILSSITTQDYYSYRLSREERIMVAAAMLISSAGFVTLASIADRLYVSRATIIGDLDEIKSFIREGGLMVTSHPNKGLLVEGKESVKRWFLFRLSAFESPDHPVGGGHDASPMINVTAGDVHTIRKILSEQNRVHRLYMTDSSFLQIQKYLGIMIARNLQGEYIEPQPDENDAYRKYAEDILHYVSQYCSVRTTEDEIRYLSGLLSHCRYIHKKDFDPRDIQVQNLTRRFIHRVSDELQIDLNDDYDFFENLSNHLESMFAADSSQFPEDQELKEIVREHTNVERAVRNNLEMLQQFNGRKITENEITYIVIHVCAALERKKNSDVSFHVILACHAGIGTSHLLMENLKKYFHFHIVDIISSHEAADLSPDQADLVISTVPLEECPIESVIVSARLTNEDYLHIGAKIDALRNSRHLPQRQEEHEITSGGVIRVAEQVIRQKITDKALAQDVMKTLRHEIRKYFREVENPAEEDMPDPLLHQLLVPSSIQLDVECENWQEAIRKSAVPLYQAGYITEKYITGMLKNVEENGPYIVLAPGLAIPHDAPENGALRTGMNLIRLKDPIPFGVEGLDPVEFVCALSAVDHRTHLHALFTLVNLFSDQEWHRRLGQAETSEQAYETIRSYEYHIEK